MILYRLDTLHLTQEKEKSSVAQCSTGWLKKFLECIVLIRKGLWLLYLFHLFLQKHVTIWFRIWEKGTNVLMYLEIWGKYGNSGLQPDGWANSTHGKLYIFGKMTLFSFQKYIVSYGYYKSIHLAIIRSSPVFPVR